MTGRALVKDFVRERQRQPAMAFTPENQVRTGLPAGGRRIRTLGPSRKGSAGTVEHLDEVGPFSGGTEGSNPSSSSDESGLVRPRRSCFPNTASALARISHWGVDFEARWRAAAG